MAVLRKDSLEQFRVSFAELAKTKRGEAVLVDPYLIGRAIALVMKECTVRSAAGRPLLWNDYRVLLARRDFDLVRSLRGHLEKDLQGVLGQEAGARGAEMIGALRVTVVFDESDELASGEGVVRVAFVATPELQGERAGELTVRFDAWERGREPVGPNTVYVDDASTGQARCVLAWPGGQVPLAPGTAAIIGRPHAEAPSGFVPLLGAGAKVNKQHARLLLVPAGLRVMRLPAANPVAVNARALAAGEEVELALPITISLSHDDLVIDVRWR